MSSTTVTSSPSAQPIASDGHTASTRSGEVGAQDFSQLLQAAGQPQAVDVTELPHAASGLVAPSALAGEAVAADLLPMDAAGWSVQSLVGQTAQLDQAADVALQDGTYLQSRLDHGVPSNVAAGWGRWVAQPSGQPPVVAQGGGSTSLQAGAADTASAASAVAATASMGIAIAADAVADTATQAFNAVVRDASTLADEGRVPLQGQWVAADKAPAVAEQMQRIMGQMAQWVSAHGGNEFSSARRGSSRESQSTELSGVDSMGAAAVGSAWRLTENAVAAAAASQNAGQSTEQQSTANPTQDMSLWMGAKQQRAEMLLDRDGQPVRVQVQVQGNEAHVTFLSDEQATRDMLDASLAQLRDLLAQQGLELAGVQVQQHSAGGQEQAGHGAARDDFMPADARVVALPQAEDAEGGGALQPRAMHGLDVFA